MLRRIVLVVAGAMLLWGVLPPLRGLAAGKLAGQLARRLRLARASDRFDVIVRVDPRRPVAVPAGVSVRAQWSRAISGYAARLTREQIEDLAARPGVRRIELDAPVKALLDTATVETGVLAARREFRVTGDGDGDPERYSRDDVVVAVIDTGIDTGHVDLAGGKVIGWYDEQYGLPLPYDDQGHGTHVASIIAGTGAGDRRYTGVAPGAALVGVKVMDAAGQGEMSDVISGIEWVLENRERFGIRIANMSLGGETCADGTDALSEAVNRAVEAGIVFVVAAGNSGPARCTVGTPAAAEEAITVGAAYDPGENGWALAEFSSRGPTGDGRIKPDVVAPGRNITAARAHTKDKYVTLSGTSMASPFVAGVAALLLAADPDLTPAQVKELLRTHVKDFGLPGPDPEYGAGIVEPYGALAATLGKEGRGFSDGLRHDFYQGELTYVGHEVAYRVRVTDPRRPLAISANLPTWRAGVLDIGLPDFVLELSGPGGNMVKKSRSGSGEEMILLRPPGAGTYTVRIRAVLGEGPYLLDISYR